MATYNSKNKLLSAVSYVISVAQSRSVPNQSMRQCHACLMGASVLSHYHRHYHCFPSHRHPPRPRTRPSRLPCESSSPTSKLATFGFCMAFSVSGIFGLVTGPPRFLVLTFRTVLLFFPSYLSLE